MAKKAATILAQAQQELLDTNAKLSDTGRRRDQLEVRGRPLDITPFADALRAASKFAVDMMRGKLDPLTALPPTTSTIDETESPGPVRSDQQERLAALLKKQAALAEDITPAGEAAYQAVVAEIAALS